MLRKFFQKINNLFSLSTLEKVYFIGFCVLLGTLSWYQLFRGEYYFQRAKNNYLKVLPLSSMRGEILDRNGISIAYDRAEFNLGVIPYQVKTIKDSLFQELSDYSSLSVGSLNKNYRRNLSSFFSPVDIITNVDKTKALELNEKFSDSLVITTRPQRYYSNPYAFAHILGYVKQAKSFYEQLKSYGYSPMERVGFGGIEQFYDTYLKGSDGGELVEVDSHGRIMGYLGQQRPQKGKDIYLTVDSLVQQAAYESLGDRPGAVILMNADNGELISLCSRPAFNPNSFIEGKNTSSFLNNSKSPLLNRALQAKYPMGSTFKPIVAVAALEEDKSKSSTTFDCNGELRLGIAKFRCSHVHGRQNLFEAIAHSCNVYFYNLGLKIGPDALSRWARKFGLDSLTDVDLPFEARGFVPDVRWKQKKLKSNWFAGDTVNFSIGQGFMTATPLATMRAMNVFASKGYLVKPQLIKKIDSVESGAIDKTYLGISERTLEKVSQGLRETILREDGTARILNRLNLKFSGKTGTAQNSGRPHGWFIGFFSYQEKTYTICVLLEHGGSSYEAVKIAYYFVKKITENKIL
ncbi:MAG: penicillin-binding protein 2 [Candidatus Omnitrophica bacterium]|nr:penicillin-binding protein 2 [Candidatus Omnitrophota bacterium]